MVEPGSIAPDFELPNANGNSGGDTLSLRDVMGENGAVIFFTCNHCPYVVGSEPRIENAAEVARKHGLGFAGINSNDPVKYESDSRDNMVKRANKDDLSISPRLFPGGGPVLGRENTGVHLLNSDYSWSTGDVWMTPRETHPATTSELEDAMEELGTNVSVPRTESIGCSVKWKE